MIKHNLFTIIIKKQKSPKILAKSIKNLKNTNKIFTKSVEIPENTNEILKNTSKISKNHEKTSEINTNQ